MLDCMRHPRSDLVLEQPRLRSNFIFGMLWTEKICSCEQVNSNEQVFLWRWEDSNSQSLGYKPSALAMELNSSKASAGKDEKSVTYEK